MFGRVLQLVREETSQPGQEAREALIDLLVWTMLVDHRALAVEAHQIRNEAAGLTWSSGLSLELFIHQSLARAGDVLGDEEAERTYLDDICLRLGSDEGRAAALTACEKLIGVDGEQAALELAHLERVRRRFARGD